MTLHYSDVPQEWDISGPIVLSFRPEAIQSGGQDPWPLIIDVLLQKGVIPISSSITWVPVPAQTNGGSEKGEWHSDHASRRSSCCAQILFWGDEPLRKRGGDTQLESSCDSHDGSMVLVYMLTWLGYIDGKCYHIYSNTMDTSLDWLTTQIWTLAFHIKFVTGQRSWDYTRSRQDPERHGQLARAGPTGAFWWSK